MVRRLPLALLASVGLAMAGCGATPSGPAAPSVAPTATVEFAPGAADASLGPAEAIESTPSERQASEPDRTVEESGGFRLATRSSASCTAEAPADWSMQARERSDSADVVSPDGTLYAGYGIQAVNTSLQAYASVYEPPLNDPDLYSPDTATVAAAYGRIIVGALGGATDLSTGDSIQATPEYRLLSVATSTHRGLIFFRADGFPGDGYNATYTLPMYFAFTTIDRFEREGLLVARVAASIRCTTQFQPPDDYPSVEAADSGGSSDGNGDDPGYNPQLGTESVHDPATGENYIVDPSTNWSATGPDGPGYYVPKSGGNDYQKLDPGRSD